MKRLMTAVGITLCLVQLLLTPDALMAHVEEDMPDAIAKIEYLMLLDINPKDVETRCKLAMIYLRQKKFQQAEDELQQVLQANPDNLHALEGMGLVKKSLEEYDEAGRYFRKALAIAPASSHIYYYLGMTLEAAGNYAGAGEAYSTAVDNHRRFVSPGEKNYNEDLAKFAKAMENLAVKTRELKGNR